ncbi:DUF7003 family protein [Microbacteriaceae bacterium 4G12]
MQSKILKVLDEKQKVFEFPLLDNFNLDMSQVKLSVFLRNSSDWLIVFQLIGVDALGISNCIYMYSNVLENNFSLVTDDTIIQLSNTEYTLFNDEGEFIPSLYEGELVIRNNFFNYHFTKQNYKNAGIEIQSLESYPTYLLRMLAVKEESRNLLWWKDFEILEEIQDTNSWEIWCEIEKWQHVVDEKVSENAFFQSLTNAIESKDVGIIKEGETNTDWKNWVEFDFENQY